MPRIKVVGSMFRDLSTLDNEEWTLTKEREASTSYECEGFVIRQRSNEHDPRALAVFAGDTHIGFIGKTTDIYINQDKLAFPMECIVTRVDLLKKENKIEYIFFVDIEK